jgi:hypothetical protein
MGQDHKRRLSLESKDGSSAYGGSGKRKGRKMGSKACVYCRRRYVMRLALAGAGGK